jgi:Zn-dependent protease
VLYALDVPLDFLALLAGFGLGIIARGLAQAWTARALGARDFELRARSTPDPRRHGDIFGLVAAVIGGAGWGRAAPIEGLLGRFAYGRARGRPAAQAIAVLLVGPVAAASVGAVLILASRAAGVPAFGLHDYAPSMGLHGDGLTGLDAGPRVLLLMGISALALAIIELVPVPPLDGGRLVLAVAPTTPGWQRVRHYADQNWGVGLLLLLLILPLSARGSALFPLIDGLGKPLLRVLSQ